MGFPLLILRLVATPILGTVIFIGFLLFMLESNLSSKLLNADFYTETIAGQDTYNRIYDKVLVDPALEDTVRSLLGDVQVVNQRDIVNLLREVLPPDYLQSQSEATIRNLVKYLNEDSSSLDIYVELGLALDRVEPTLFAYIDGRIDKLPEKDTGPIECTPNKVNEMAESFQATFGELTVGGMPVALPSIKGIEEPCRALMFDFVFDGLLSDILLDQRVKDGLQSNRAEIAERFVAADIHGVMKQAARPLATPLIADALDRIRAKLDDQDRVDVIAQIAKWRQGQTEEQLRADIEVARGKFIQYRLLGQTWSLVILIGGTVVMGVLYLPNLSSALRYPGISLFGTGILFFGIGKFAESRTLDWMTTQVDRVAAQVPDVPASIIALGSDLAIAFGQQLADGFTTHAVTLIIVGVFLIVASFFMMVVRRVIPGLG